MNVSATVAPNECYASAGTAFYQLTVKSVFVFLKIRRNHLNVMFAEYGISVKTSQTNQPPD